jgi:hypothetical protein
MIAQLLAAAALVAAPDTIVVAPVGPHLVAAGIAAGADSTQQGRRPRSVEVSDAYAARLKVHRIASYAAIPLFATQYLAGRAMYNAHKNADERPAWARSVHRPTAYALSAMFAVNAVTGTLNWWEGRRAEPGRLWRTAHAVVMVGAASGLAYTFSMGADARVSGVDRDAHRRWAIGSSVAALTGYAMMWGPIRRDK